MEEKADVLEEEEPFVFRPLNEGDLQELLFPDKLFALTKSDAQAGEYKVSFELVRVGGEAAVKVEARADGVLAGVPTGTRVSALLDLSLHTLHEQCSEYLQLPGSRLLERRWTLERATEGIRWSRHSRCSVPPNSDSWRSDGALEVSAAEAVIGEAAALLLQRLLVLRPALLGIPGGQPLRAGQRWRVLTVDREGCLRPCSFVWLDEMTTRGLVGVQRTLSATQHAPERSWESWYGEGGRLVVRKQNNWPVAMRAPGRREEEEQEERKKEETITDRRPSVTASGCFCGLMPHSQRQHNSRSQRQ